MFTSELLEPSSVTVTVVATVWSSPASVKRVALSTIAWIFTVVSTSAAVRPATRLLIPATLSAVTPAAL